MPKKIPMIANPPASTSLARLEWDSNHFGFPVAKIAGEESDSELHAALSEARLQRYRLVYWAASVEREAPAWLLADFEGRLVDRKVGFARALLSREPEPSSDVAIAPFNGAGASAELIALAVAAGGYSRFAVDTRIPREKFEQLYRSWIERSVRGEMAGTVLVARDKSGSQVTARSADSSGDAPLAMPLAGMITVQVTNSVGNIGLIAVAETHRGRGIGSHLMAAAHRWMLDHGAAKTTVVTQAANVPACRLYERTGYKIEQAENYYHFWP